MEGKESEAKDSLEDVLKEGEAKDGLGPAELKVILLGDSAVGKSKLVERFLMNDYQPRQLSTYALTLFRHTMNHDGKDIPVDIWDTAGQERFASMHPSYYYRANACILVFDVTRKSTYQHLEDWYKEMRRYCENIPCICVANKIDVNYEVTKKKFKFAEKYKLPFFYVSAADGTNVVKVFQEACKLAYSYKNSDAEDFMRDVMELLDDDTLGSGDLTLPGGDEESVIRFRSLFFYFFKFPLNPQSLMEMNTESSLSLSSTELTKKKKKRKIVKVLRLPKLKSFQSTTFVKASLQRKKTFFSPISSSSAPLIVDSNGYERILKQQKRESDNKILNKTRGNNLLAKSFPRRLPSVVLSEPEFLDTSPIIEEDGFNDEDHNNYSEDDAEKSNVSDFSYPSDDELHFPELQIIGPEIAFINQPNPPRPVYQSNYSRIAKKSNLTNDYTLQTFKLINDVNSHLGNAYFVLNGKRKKKTTILDLDEKNNQEQEELKNEEKVKKANFLVPLILNEQQKFEDASIAYEKAYDEMIFQYGEEAVKEALGPLDSKLHKIKIKVNKREAWKFSQNLSNPKNTWTKCFDPTLQKCTFYDHRTGVSAMESTNASGWKELVKIDKNKKRSLHPFLHLLVKTRVKALEQLNAATRIQLLFRSRKAKMKVNSIRKEKQLEIEAAKIDQAWCKLYNPVTKHYYYYNQYNHQSSMSLPENITVISKSITNRKLKALMIVQRAYRGFRGRKLIKDHARKIEKEIRDGAFTNLLIKILNITNITNIKPLKSQSKVWFGRKEPTITFATMKYEKRIVETVAIESEENENEALSFKFPLLFNVGWEGVPLYIKNAARSGTIKNSKKNEKQEDAISPKGAIKNENIIEFALWKDINGELSLLGIVNLDINQIKKQPSNEYMKKSILTIDASFPLLPPPNVIVNENSIPYLSTSIENEITSEVHFSFSWASDLKCKEILDQVVKMNIEKPPKTSSIDYFIENEKLALLNFKSRRSIVSKKVDDEEITFITGPRIEIKLISGKDLPSFRFMGKADPVAEISYGSLKKVSSIISKTSNPQWEEIFVFPFKETILTAEIKIADKDSNRSDSILGQVILTLTEIVNEDFNINSYDDSYDSAVLTGRRVVNQKILYHPLMEKKAQSKVSGELNFEISWFKIPKVFCKVCKPIIKPNAENDIVKKVISQKMTKEEIKAMLEEEKEKEIVDALEAQRSALKGHPRLEISILKGSNFASFDFMGKSDPFVEIQVDEKKVYSSVIYKSLFPDWSEDQPHVFPLSYLQNLIILRVFDKDSKENEIMGVVNVSLHDLFIEAASHGDTLYKVVKTYPLLPDASMDKKTILTKVKGELSFSLSWFEIDVDKYLSDIKEIKELVPKKTALIVTIISASNLAKFDSGIFAKSDPWVKVLYGEETKATDVIFKDLNPKFNKVMNFDFNESSNYLECFIYDRDEGKKGSQDVDELMGYVKIDYKNSNESENDYPIQFHTSMKENDKRKVQGVLRVKIQSY